MDSGMAEYPLKLNVKTRLGQSKIDFNILKRIGEGCDLNTSATRA